MGLYIFDEIDLAGYGFYDGLKSFLSEQRLSKVNRLRSQSGKTASAAVYLLLRIALIETYGINEAVIFELGKNKKPFLKDYPHILFNLSHSNNAVACALADVEIGTDIQQIRETKDKLAKRVLTADEYLGFLKDPVPDDYFCEIWTIKESYLKMTGAGITKELGDITAEDVSFKRTIRGNDYFCSVCAADKLCIDNLKVKYVRRDDFELLRK